MIGAEAASSPAWRTLAEETLCRTPFLRLDRERVATPARPGGVEWVVVRRSAAAVVAPRTPQGDFLLIRQERVPVRREVWEFPAGQVDGEVNAESLRGTARRELGEETGCECRGELTALGLFFSSVGFTDECCHLFLATDVVPRGQGSAHDAQEAILAVRAFPPAELRNMVAAGVIVDSNTLATYARLEARGLLR